MNLLTVGTGYRFIIFSNCHWACYFLLYAYRLVHVIFIVFIVCEAAYRHITSYVLLCSLFVKQRIVISTHRRKALIMTWFCVISVTAGFVWRRSNNYRMTEVKSPLVTGKSTFSIFSHWQVSPTGVQIGTTDSNLLCALSDSLDGLAQGALHVETVGAV